LPHPEIGTTDLIATVGTTFFFASLCFNFVILLGTIVREKELHLREAFEVAGMVRNAYWLAFAITGILQNLVSSLILIAAGAAFQFRFFLYNDFATYFLLFWLFSVSLVPLACFMSAFVKQSRTAASIGFALVLVGFIIQFVATALFVESTAQVYQVLLKLIPLSMFAQGLSLLSAASDSQLDDGLRFSQRGEGYFSLEMCYVWLLIDTAIYSVLAWYFDHVIYFGRRAWFFLLPSFWLNNRQAVRPPNPRPREHPYDGDVEAERRECKKLVEVGSFRGVAIGGVTKTFGSFTAVDDVHFSIAEGTITALLGHNGAGKCLARGTRVLTQRGEFVAVERVAVGDVLVGDDNRPRRVLSITTGREAMAVVKRDARALFRCNRSHVLTLSVGAKLAPSTGGGGAQWYERTTDELGVVTALRCCVAPTLRPSATTVRAGDVIDMSVATYLALPSAVAQQLRGVLSRGVDFMAVGNDASGANDSEALCATLFSARVVGLPRWLKYGSRAERHKFLSCLVAHVRRRGNAPLGSRQTADDIAFVARSCGLEFADAAGLRVGTSLVPTTTFAMQVEAESAEDDYFGFQVDGNGRFVVGDEFVVTHNSTLIRCLTGQWTPTSGDASVYGHSLTSEIGIVRRNLGLCPQHDILVDTLSPAQNIELFCAFKGMTRVHARAEAARLLKVVDLSHVSEKPSNQLSGGMQRRLSIAIALAGDPALVLFDEPTAPIDIVSRRAIWNAIDSLRDGRCILLCTHSMEEAETLSDRIAIMKAGAIAAYGSTLTLKRKYGDGVLVTLTLVDKSYDKQVQRHVERMLSGATLTRVADVVKVRVPNGNSSEQLADFFEVLERERDPLGVVDMSVALSSMEDVFVRIADEGHAEPQTKPPSRARVICMCVLPWFALVCCVLVLIIAIGAAVAPVQEVVDPSLLPTNISFWRDGIEPTRFDLNKLNATAFPWPTLVGDVNASSAFVSVRTTLDRVGLRVYRADGNAWTLLSDRSVADVATVAAPRDQAGLLAAPVPSGNATAQRATLAPGAAQLVLAPMRDVDANNVTAAGAPLSANATLAGATCYIFAPLTAASVLFANDSCVTAVPFAPRVRLLSALNATLAAQFDAVVFSAGNLTVPVPLPPPGVLTPYFDMAPGLVSFALRVAATNATTVRGAAPLIPQRPFTLVVREDTAVALFDFSGEAPVTGAQSRITVLDGTLVDATPRQLVRLGGPVSDRPVARTARIALSGLESNRAFRVFAHAVGNEQSTSTVAALRTANEQTMRARRSVFGATSAFGPLNQPFPTLTKAAAERLDFMVVAGDAVYTRGLRSNADVRGAWDTVLNMSGVVSLAQSTSVVALADDGELGAGALGVAAFRDTMPVSTERNATVAYRAVRFGPVHLILLDVRGERNATAKELISATQLTWAKQELLDSRAAFKLVVSGVPMSNIAALLPEGEANRWTGYPAQRNELLKHIRDNKIKGVVFVGADVGFAALYRLEQPPTNPSNATEEETIEAGDPESLLGSELFEVLVGPAGSSIAQEARFSFALAAPSKQLLYTSQTWTYTRFTALETAVSQLLTVDFVNDEGAFVFQRQLNLTEPATRVIGSGSRLTVAPPIIVMCAIMFFAFI
jgi:ABC-type multidrug transport system ATPase subunit/phosphodiesterase/alkaline phosphatase D-like protein